MKHCSFHPEAEAEADAAFEYYWIHSPTAAINFDAELRAAYSNISRMPGICSPYLYGTRRALLNRYPLSVVFRERLHGIQIVAIAHAKRRPGYWTKRLRQ